jgi:hypothetical protein
MQKLSRCGDFLHCEVFCPDLVHEGKVGCTFTNFSMCDMMRTRECLASYVVDHDKYMYHRIFLDPVQFDKFTSWNDRQVNHKCKYNYSDLCRQMIPAVIAQNITREVDMSKLYHQKLYCSQAVVLALRASLGLDHIVCKALAPVTSRLSTPSIVSKHLSAVLGAPIQLPLLSY